MTPAARFREFVARPGEAGLDLATGALLFALNEYPGLDVERYLGQLDALGGAVRQRVRGKRDPYQILHAVNRLLFEDEGFAGNAASYYDPRNSFLNEVLDRKLGIPISLSVVYLEIASRARLPLRGVGFPGHFIVRYDHPDETVYIDPYNAGRVLTREDLRAMGSRFAGRDEPLETRLLHAAPGREILLRMLRNLKHIYADATADPKLLWVTEFLLLLDPDSAEDARDHGLAAMRLGRYPEALGALFRYASLDPDASDAPRVLETIRELRKLSAQMN